jgi:hypothetical protein
MSNPNPKPVPNSYSHHLTQLQSSLPNICERLHFFASSLYLRKVTTKAISRSGECLLDTFVCFISFNIDELKYDFSQSISGAIAIVIAITVRHILSTTAKGHEAASTSTVVRVHRTLAHLRKAHAERLVIIGLICVVLFSVSFAITLQTTPLMELFREETDARY